MRVRLFALLMIAALLVVGPAFAQDPVELRIAWYDDGAESEVLEDLLERFHSENPDIRVVVDPVPYDSILTQLPTQLAAGEGPDMARVTDLGGLSEYYLDMSPYLSDTAYWEDNFGPFLNWLRPDDSEAIPGFMTQLTVTGPFVNKTFFDQAEIEMPGEGATWEDWAAASAEVAEALDIDFAMAMDRSGHRLGGPAISQGAAYFDEDGHPVIDDGFRTMAELMIEWHEEGLMPAEVWIGAGGSYEAAAPLFINGQTVFYMAGSWQIGNFTNNIGDAFDWVAVPNPCGPAACTGMPGGAALVGIGDTEHPEEVARVMEYLASEEVLAEFYARNLFIPGHLGLAESGVDFETELDLTADALSQFVAEVGKLSQVAFDYQAYPFNRIMFNVTADRLTQAMIGELTLDEAIARMQDDIDTQLAETE